MVESVVGILANYLLPYLILSVLAMLVVELLAALTDRRAKVLQQFIRGMLCDPDGTGLAGKFYGHHLIKSLAMRGNRISGRV